MFADEFTLKFGDAVIRGRRLTIGEIRRECGALTTGNLSVERSEELIKSHCRLDDGSEFDPDDLTPDQLRTLIAEMTLPKEGRGISDFIGLLC